MMIDGLGLSGGPFVVCSLFVISVFKELGSLILSDANILQAIKVSSDTAGPSFELLITEDITISSKR